MKDKQTKTTKNDRSKKTTATEKLKCDKYIAFQLDIFFS
jgi:hypothetical protein